MPGAQILCPGCNHPAREHGMDVGCVHGWIADQDGCGAVTEGCRCHWAHIAVSPAVAEMEVARCRSSPTARPATSTAPAPAPRGTTRPTNSPTAPASATRTEHLTTRRRHSRQEATAAGSSH